jgi:hypothetical protein
MKHRNLSYTHKFRESKRSKHYPLKQQLAYKLATFHSDTAVVYKPNGDGTVWWGYSKRSPIIKVRYIKQGQWHGPWRYKDTSID